MREIRIGNFVETAVERSDYPPDKIRKILGSETVAVLGYGVQGRGQSLNMRDNGVRVIIGQRPGGKSWDEAVKDGWKPGETLFDVEEAVQRGTIIQYLLSDAGQKEMWPKIKPLLTAGKALYFSHGFSIVFSDQTGVIPTKDIDVILVAPKGSGTTVRRLFVEGRGINASFAIHQDATGRGARPLLWRWALPSAPDIYSKPRLRRKSSATSPASAASSWAQSTGSGWPSMKCCANMATARPRRLTRRSRRRRKAFIRSLARTAWIGCTPIARRPPSAGARLVQAVPGRHQGRLRGVVPPGRDRRRNASACSRRTAGPIIVSSWKRNLKKCARAKCGRPARPSANFGRSGKRNKQPRAASFFGLTGLSARFISPHLKPLIRGRDMRRVPFLMKLLAITLIGVIGCNSAEKRPRIAPPKEEFHQIPAGLFTGPPKYPEGMLNNVPIRKQDDDELDKLPPVGGPGMSGGASAPGMMGR